MCTSDTFRELITRAVVSVGETSEPNERYEILRLCTRASSLAKELQELSGTALHLTSKIHAQFAAGRGVKTATDSNVLRKFRLLDAALGAWLKEERINSIDLGSIDAIIATEIEELTASLSVAAPPPCDAAFSVLASSATVAAQQGLVMAMQASAKHRPITPSMPPSMPFSMPFSMPPSMPPRLLPHVQIGTLPSMPPSAPPKLPAAKHSSTLPELNTFRPPAGACKQGAVQHFYIGDADDQSLGGSTCFEEHVPMAQKIHGMMPERPSSFEQSRGKGPSWVPMQALWKLDHGAAKGSPEAATKRFLNVPVQMPNSKNAPGPAAWNLNSASALHAPLEPPCTAIRALGVQRPLRSISPTATALAIRNIPARYRQEQLLQEWPADGTYDFLHLPYSRRKKKSLCYAFVNFKTHALAVAFQEKWHGKHLKDHGRTRALDITSATVQGYGPNLARFRSISTEDPGNEDNLPATFDGIRRLDTRLEIASLGSVD